jgi:hypothetical protein
MRPGAICLLLAALTGCYNYGYRSQGRLFWSGPDTAFDVQQVRAGRDGRDRREAIIRMVRARVYAAAEERAIYPTRAVVLAAVSLHNEPNPIVRAIATAALREIGLPEDAPLSARSLRGEPATGEGRDPSPVVRREAARTLALLGTARDIPALDHALRSDTDPQTRVEAAISLTEIGAREAIEPLLRGLGDMDESVTFACHRGLVRLSGMDLPPAAAEWNRWWEANKAMPIPEREPPLPLRP